MQPEHRDSDDPKEWLRRARSNLSLAVGSRGLAEVVWEDLCFEAQQAAEKAIKAVLVCRGVVFPKTHVISELITLLQQSGLEVPDRVRESAVLTPYAILTRYPGFPESISEEDYASAIELAERVYRWAESLIA